MFRRVHVSSSIALPRNTKTLPRVTKRSTHSPGPRLDENGIEILPGNPWDQQYVEGVRIVLNDLQLLVRLHR